MVSAVACPRGCDGGDPGSSSGRTLCTLLTVLCPLPSTHQALSFLFPCGPGTPFLSRSTSGLDPVPPSKKSLPRVPLCPYPPPPCTQCWISFIPLSSPQSLQSTCHPTTWKRFSACRPLPKPSGFSRDKAFMHLFVPLPGTVPGT